MRTCMSVCGREWGGERWGWGVGGEGEERGKDLAIKNWALGLGTKLFTGRKKRKENLTFV